MDIVGVVHEVLVSFQVEELAHDALVTCRGGGGGVVVPHEGATVLQL